MSSGGDLAPVLDAVPLLWYRFPMTKLDLSTDTPQMALKLKVIRDYEQINIAAKALGISRASLSGIINGDRISPAHAKLIEDKFDIPANGWDDRLKR